MNLSTSVRTENAPSPHHWMQSTIGKHKSVWAWSLLLLFVNLPLLWGEIRTGLIFLPEAVAQGQW